MHNAFFLSLVERYHRNNNLQGYIIHHMLDGLKEVIENNELIVEAIPSLKIIKNRITRFSKQGIDINNLTARDLIDPVIRDTGTTTGSHCNKILWRPSYNGVINHMSSWMVTHCHGHLTIISRDMRNPRTAFPVAFVPPQYIADHGHSMLHRNGM
ncbi:hypothetical protein Glove_232g116 [Diversispora epigaea]|uniref:Uncharacterized protein n=1 Tax=Diversispora epigaea TaxID=1348612 RepID=A0A397IBQ6_9GLOM|nr:hypothetical protein Glove_232g116 [Diversispora epigaea]